MGFFYGKNMLIQHLTTQLTRPCFESFEDFSVTLLNQDKQDSLQAVAEVGLRCSNLSQAFALAYRCALQALLPQLKQNQWAAMCVTESLGNHPKHIQTVINKDGSVSGEKSFVTMAGLAQQLLVIAKQGERDGRPVLKAVLVDADQAQVSVTQMPAMSMLKDIPHGAVSLKEAKGQVLAGDGHEDYSKVFRVLEDAHILMAASCLVLNQAYRFGLVEVMQTALGLVSFVSGLKLVSSPWVHLQLAQGFNQFLELCADFEKQMAICGDEFEQTWHKDKKLFSIASGARQARTEKAIQAVL
jgi:alkylation response protein AidB-like acyl-CoA dehydrogenase